MIKLIIDNSFVEIRGANKECEFEIWDKLSFEIENFNSPYIQKKHLFNRKTIMLQRIYIVFRRIY